MAKSIRIDPITRIEGHLALKVDIEGSRIRKAYSSGEMFRGFETILRGRHPMDAQQITQRICGVCPVSHGIASVLAQEMAYGVTPAKNGRLIRNLVLGANYIQSHILHFYHLSALDFVDIAAITKYRGDDPDLNGLKKWVTTQLASNSTIPAAPFLPRYKGKYIQNTSLNILGVKHYVEALEMRRLAHECVAIFAGKAPHVTALVPGGVTERVTVDKITRYSANLKKLRSFIDECYIPDVLAVAKAFPEYFKLGKGTGNFLSYGVFRESDGGEKLLPDGVVLNGRLGAFDPGRISEDVGCSMFSSPSGLKPESGVTVPDPHKTGAYSWIKAPRYDGNAMEVGPLARLLVAYHRGNTEVKNIIGNTLKSLGRPAGDLESVLGRHAARALEAKLVADRCAAWIEELVPGNSSFTDFDVPASASGYGLTEAPRGALGHWITIKNHKIANYQCVVPTTWNCSPRDDRDVPGVVEQALVGTPIADSANPIEATRIVRSFDPCLACAVH